MNINKIKNWPAELAITKTFTPKEINEWSYFTAYQKKVIKLSKKVYNKIKDNHLLTVKGYSVDHIVPISYGWEHKIEPELMADIENLQVLPLIKNIIKANKIDYSDPRVVHLLDKWRVESQ